MAQSDDARPLRFVISKGEKKPKRPAITAVRFGFLANV